MTKNQSVMLISHNNYAGGAARAAARLYACLSNNREIEFLVAKKVNDDPKIKQLKNFRSYSRSSDHGSDHYQKINFIKICYK